MRIPTLILVFITALAFTVTSQNLYTQQNAANIQNEANAITGWIGPANVESVTGNAQNGTFSLRLTTTNAGRDGRYSFTAVVGTVYNISIWARKGANNANTAFENWVGFQNFTTTQVTSTSWLEYTFTLTATSTNPQIRVTASQNGPPGRQGYIDAITITAVAADTQAPTAPSNLTASSTTTTATTLNWNASTDNVGVTQYQIRRNNVIVGTVGGTITTYNATGLTASTTYSFDVLALDAAGNVSPPSNTVQVTTGAAADTQAPTAPSNLTASNTTTTATTLNWNASTDNVGVTQYQIRRNNAIVGTVGGTITTYNATGLTASTTYSFDALALDAAGNVSPPSNTIQVTTLSGGNGTSYTNQNANLPTVNWQAQNLYVSGTMGIGTSANSNFQLSVNGDIRTKELVVESGWSDFVFKPGYLLPSLKETEQYIRHNGHLKDIPSAAHVQANGIGLAEINMRLLQKVEELTLYLIEAQKRLELLEIITVQPTAPKN